MNEKLLRVLLNLKSVFKKKTKLLIGLVIILLMSSTVVIVNPEFTNDMSDVSSNQSVFVALANDSKTLEPYDYIAPTGVGTFGYYKVNEIFFRDWLNNTVTWRVEKSTDGVKWTEYTKFEVKKDWDSKSFNEKHTIVVTSDEEAYYRILTNTNPDKQLISYTDKSILPDVVEYDETTKTNITTKVSSNDYELKFKVNDKSEYTVIYNWDDYLKSDMATNSTFAKEVKTDSLSKQFFEWSVVSTSKLKQDETFVLDPTYGVITDAVIDTFEWDNIQGQFPDMVRLGNSEYYAIAAMGDGGSDGWLYTIKVWNDNGTIRKVLVDSFQYDDSDSNTQDIINVANDIYAISYRDITGDRVKVITITIDSSNGDIGAIIDTISLTYDANYPFIINVTNNVFCIAYMEAGTGGGGATYDGFIETIWINASGTINDTILDTIEYESVLDADCPVVCLIDSDTIGIVYSAYSADSNDGYLSTWNITSTGDISATYADKWEFDNAYGRYPYIKKIGANTYVISNRDTATNMQIRTVTIVDTGMITESWIDTLSLGTGALPYIFYVSPQNATADIYGIAMQGVDADGFIYTVNITSTGSIDATYIDYLEFNTSDCIWRPVVTYVANNYYLIVYEGGGNDGWSCTVEILRYVAEQPPINTAPTQNSNIPVNNTGCNDINPILTIFAYDDNGNTMNITWMSNSSGSWVEFGNNLSIANGTYNMSTTNFSSCNTTYFWSVNLSDGNGGYNNMTYYLRTAGPTNIVIFSPANESINVELTPILKIYANNTCGKLLNIYWYENSTGSWELRQSNLSVPSNTTYQYLDTYANDFNTTYGWMVAVNSTSCNVSQTCTFRTYQEPPTHIALYGLTDFWNMTWSANEDNATALMPEIVYTNDSGINYETMIINCIVNSTERISNVTITHDELNLSTDYGTKLYADNITVWVSANGGAWFIPNCDLGYGRGRFTPTGGSINLNVTSWDGANSPFSDYYNGTNNAISENCTILVRLQLNVTMDTPHGYFVNQTYLSGGSPYIYAYNYSGIYSEIIYFTSQARIYGNAMNYGVVLSHPNPANNSVGNPLSFTWNITAEDPNGDNFDWSIECYGLNNNGVGDVNGSKTLAIVVPNWCTNYTVYVNATDGANFTTEYFYFTTQSMPNATISNPIPANGSTGQLTSFNWSIDINSPSGEWFNVTIQCNNGNINYSNNSVNGTFYINLTGLSQSTTYTVWVNVTNNCSNETREWFTFTTRGNNAPIQHNEIPTNHSINVPLIDDDKHVNLNVTIEDPDGNTMNYTITLSHGGTFCQNFDVTNGSIVCVPTDLEYCTNYTWYVNVTDRYTWTNQTYWFVTEAMPACVAHNPNPVNNSIHNLLGFTWNVTIESPKSEWFDWTIECHGQSSLGNDETNGSKTLALTGLDWCTNYTVYVNTTNNCSNASNFYYYFTTQAMSNVTVSNPNPANNSVNVGLAFNFSVDIESPNGEWFDVDIECNNTDINSTVNCVNDTYYLNITGLSYSTMYVVWVNTTNNCSNETRVWFMFTTTSAPVIPTVNQNPNQTSPSPNGSVCQPLTQTLVIYVYDDNANTMNLTWWSNSSGGWIEFDVNLTITNGTYNQTNSNFSSPCTTYYWSINLSDGMGGWNNRTYSFRTACCPTIHLSYVVNESTGTSMQPIMIIYANDSCGLPLVIDFYQNTSGTWEHNQTNNSAANQTVYWNYTNASTNSHTYFWRVTINNSYCNVSYTYWFTTIALPPAVMMYLVIECLYPINNSILVNSSTGIPTCVNITLHNGDWELYELIFYSNSSGAWVFFGNLTIVHNGSYCILNVNFTGLNDTYYWNVSVYNATVINSSSVFKFTTNSSFVMAGVERDMFNYLPFLLFSVIFYIMYEKRKRRKR